MIGGVSISPADTSNVYALLKILADPAAAKVALDEINARAEQAEAAFAAAREENQKMIAAQEAAYKDRQLAQAERAQAQSLHDEAAAIASQNTADLTRRDVALVAREKALGDRSSALKARESAVSAKEAEIAPLHDAATQAKTKAEALLAAAQNTKAEVDGRLARIKAAAA